ncbi:GGDEF domain-containing protein [Vreelandella aquamarina]|uniref:sensor domain-containing diguanylate cyclase n=1 Tax=Vreelandella aquamarina TaxID=77097 RepID=UPI00384DF929
MRRLHFRLLLAISIPLIVVSSTLLPILNVHMETQLGSLRAKADAVLKVGQETLTRDINESLNYALAIAEMPALRQYLMLQSSNVLANQRSEQLYSLSELSQLSTFLDTLISHYPRYSTFVLMDNLGREMLRAPQSAETRPTIFGNHASTDYFQEASKLLPRDIYISPPGRNLQYEAFSGEVIPVVNIATPVFSATGDRLGVVLLRLNWDYLTKVLQQAMLLDSQASMLLVDAQGRWLLNTSPTPSNHLMFGGNYANLAPDYWAALQQRNKGYATLDNHLLHFQTEDIRTQRYRSLAGQLFSHSDFHPWVLGVAFPRPTWQSLIKQETTVVWFLLLTYGIAMSFGVFWAFSSQRQSQLRRAAQRQAIEVSDLYENAPCGYHSLDKKGRVVKMNKTELKWLGYPEKKVLGKAYYRNFISPETQPAFDAAFAKVQQGQEASAECSLLTYHGERRHVMIQASAYQRNGRFVHSRATVFDLTERKQLEEKLRAQAMTDPLTGVYNRRYLQNQAAIEMARARRHHYPIALLAIDIDHFKHINDEYGHDAGDDVLKHFTQVIISLLRQEDLLCRVGGEEFAVLLPNTELPQAEQVAERIRKAIENAEVTIESEGTQQTIKVTTSLGVTLVDEIETSLKPAIKRADIGLYQAKEAGRNRVTIN